MSVACVLLRDEGDTCGAGCFLGGSGGARLGSVGDGVTHISYAGAPQGALPDSTGEGQLSKSVPWVAGAMQRAFMQGARLW